MDIAKFIGGDWKELMGNNMSNKITDINVDALKDEFTDEELDALEDYFWSNLAKNNEDEVGCDYWMSNLGIQEGRDIIKIKDEVELDLTK